MPLKDDKRKKKAVEQMSRQELEAEIHSLRQLEALHQKAVQQDETRLKTILETSPVGIGRIGKNGFSWVNQAFYAMLGYKEKELVGKKGSVLFANIETYKREKASMEHQINQHGRATIEAELIRGDGTSLACIICASPFNPDDLSMGYIVNLTDASELHNLQQQLRQAQKMEALGVLAGGIAHNFNNILMGIQGHISILKSNLSPDHPLIAHTTSIEAHLASASSLTGRILGFARKGNHEPQHLDPGEIVIKTLELFASSRQEITIHTTHEKPLWKVKADPSQIEQVMLNLFVNASQAMPQGGDLYVGMKKTVIKRNHNYPFDVKPGRYVCISVRDTGVGMPPEVQERVFEPFFTTKKQTDQERAGLGLASAYGIVKSHRGFIVVKSQVGKGATFEIYFPAMAS
ncbi:sensory box histidine kinase family protein [Desulforapulum autotrophicum HRM2]|uniref:histidine kinase n=1 Tax=Desulforapulum autotrophicum (strain ATCC 43914 / DSM 3382 / VKM B-1955 / HRM2) TaxID=177437 RepID=C0QHI0_DESAH|nr:PAS domain-containing sensor histidine kinase [Desulforapulum autotrophicum]ACN17839.1 sensory box histidine kinase family protein [Desulforapulum autotrophicum HRM2]